jgi:hydrogenase nickel incorporation protein HypA/HybF
MHELSIAEALIEQVKREVHRSGQGGQVQRLELSIGRLSGVSCDSLRFAFELLAPGTLVEKAKVSILQPKAVCRCESCKASTEIDEIVARCPKCGSMDIIIDGGRDLILQTIDLEDN